jgi:hypothetical protein
MKFQEERGSPVRRCKENAGNRRNPMTCLRTMLLTAAATGALCASAAAMPSSTVLGEASLLENVAVVCNARGRCWETDDAYVDGGRGRYYCDEPPGAWYGGGAFGGSR